MCVGGGAHRVTMISVDLRIDFIISEPVMTYILVRVGLNK